MKQEDKELLLKDLCARLPFGVYCFINDESDIPRKLIRIEVDEVDGVLLDFLGNDPFLFPQCYLSEVKPYLRPISSMTEEEKEEMHNLLSPEGTAIYKNDGIALPINHYGEYVTYEFMNRIIQYLLKNHFDFSGLIQKGLAIEVTEDNNPYKK